VTLDRLGAKRTHHSIVCIERYVLMALSPRSVDRKLTGGVVYFRNVQYQLEEALLIIADPYFKIFLYIEDLYNGKMYSAK
jgi:hypothetical protein